MSASTELAQVLGNHNSEDVGLAADAKKPSNGESLKKKGKQGSMKRSSSLKRSPSASAEKSSSGLKKNGKQGSKKRISSLKRSPSASAEKSSKKASVTGSSTTKNTKKKKTIQVERRPSTASLTERGSGVSSNGSTYLFTIKNHLGVETDHLLKELQPIHGCSNFTSVLGVGEALSLKDCVCENEWSATFLDPLRDSMRTYILDHHAHCPKCRNESQFNHLAKEEPSEFVVGDTKRFESLCKDANHGLEAVITEQLKAAKKTFHDFITEEIGMPLGEKDVFGANLNAIGCESLIAARAERDRVVSSKEDRGPLTGNLAFAALLCEELDAAMEILPVEIPHLHTSLVETEVLVGRAKATLNFTIETARYNLKKMESQGAVGEVFKVFDTPLMDNLKEYIQGIQDRTAKTNKKKKKKRTSRSKSPGPGPKQEVYEPFIGFGSSDDSKSDTPVEEDASTYPQPEAGRIHVVVRMRPMGHHEKGTKASASVSDDNRIVEFKVPEHKSLGQVGKKKHNDDGVPYQTLEFDVATDRIAQDRFFTKSGCDSLVDQVLKGNTATVFAYGQTGSGKTFTMQGPAHTLGAQAGDRPTMELPPHIDQFVAMMRDYEVENQGIMYRSARKIFASDDVEEVTLSYFEIYNEKVNDLLAEGTAGAGLEVHEDPISHNFYVQDLKVVTCGNLDDFIRTIQTGVKNRRVCAHGHNSESSRSHAILTINVKTKEGKTGKLVVADLAGSDTGKEGSRAAIAERATINMSLLELGNCISEMKSKKGRANFRNSKLTQLLKDSLTGVGYTLLITTTSPSEMHFDETANSLYFASKAANIKKSTVVPLTVHEKEIFDLQQKLGTMELKIQHLEDRKTYLEDKLQQNDIEFDPDQDENGGS